MEEFVLKNRKKIIASLACLTIGALISFSAANLFWGDNFLFNMADAQTATSTVSVTAVVEAWLIFQISTTTLDIEPSLVQADGTFNVGSTPDLDLELGTNHPDGWKIEIRGENSGLYSDSRGYTISSVSGTSTIATGTEAYGANATSTNADVGEYYNFYGTDTVGEITTTTDRTLVSKATANAQVSVANMRVKATAGNTTPPANDYSDTITLTASAPL